MEDMPKLEGVGILYREVLRSADISMAEETPGVYRISGTSPTGKPIEGYLDNNDFNNCSKRLQHILGLLAEKLECGPESLGHQEHYTMDQEGLKKKQEIDRLLRGETDE